MSIDSEDYEPQIFFTKKELFMDQAPSFNFELSEDQILARALKDGYVTKVGDDEYLYNNDFFSDKK